MNEKTEGDQNKFLNRLSFKKNPKYSDQYIAIYPDAAKDSLGRLIMFYYLFIILIFGLL